MKKHGAIHHRRLAGNHRHKGASLRGFPERKMEFLYSRCQNTAPVESIPQEGFDTARGAKKADNVVIWAERPWVGRQRNVGRGGADAHEGGS